MKLSRLELADHFNPNPQERPIIVTLCGSTRFWRTFQEASLAETEAGHMVFSIGAAKESDDDTYGHLPSDEYERIKNRLDTLHYWKIYCSDEILVLNVGGYIGESTRAEIEVARRLDKRIRYWEPIAQEE